MQMYAQLSYKVELQCGPTLELKALIASVILGPIQGVDYHL